MTEVVNSEREGLFQQPSPVGSDAGMTSKARIIPSVKYAKSRNKGFFKNPFLAGIGHLRGPRRAFPRICGKRLAPPARYSPQNPSMQAGRGSVSQEPDMEKNLRMEHVEIGMIRAGVEFLQISIKLYKYV